MSANPPRKIGKYELLEFLGGGMAHVYRARDTVLERTVALKILTAEGAGDPETRARFLQEARISSNVIHDNIIRIHDYGEHEERPYLVMEFLEGEDLRNAILRQHTGGVEDKLKIALQLARALDFVHRAGIIHRDIKPENVHIDKSGRVRLMDFGIAKAKDLSLTRTGYSMGTPYYMAPEQVLGRPASPLMDVYAFGMVLYELFTGLRPMEGDTVQRLFYMILHEPVDLEPLRQSGAPPEAVELIAACIAKEPAERPPGFSEICRALEAILGAAAPPLGASQLPASSEVPAPEPAGPDTPAASPASAGRPIARRGWFAAALAVAGLAAAVVGYFYLARRHAAPSGARASREAPLPPSMRHTTTGDMVLVPSGTFLKGKDNQSASLPAFYIDRTEVTREAYARFAASRGTQAPEGSPDLPVVDVTFEEARAFCQWAGKRLPTGDEWEKAARGADGRVYSWGNAADSTRARVNSDGLSSSGPAAADSYPQGASPYGALHLTGNVHEWVDQPVEPSARARSIFSQLLDPPLQSGEPWRAVRGGSFDRPLAEAAAYEYMAVPARFHAPNIGFRCAAGVDQ